MKRIIQYLQKVENMILILSFASMVICSFAQVVNRNFIKAPIAWFDEMATFSMIYMVLLGTEAGLRDGTQIRVTAVVDRFGGYIRIGLDILARLVVIGFSGNVLYNAVRLVQRQMETRQMSAVMGIPMVIPYMSLVISFAIIVAVQSAEVVLTLIQARRASGEKEVEA